MALLHLRLRCDKLNEADLDALQNGLKNQTLPYPLIEQLTK